MQFEIQRVPADIDPEEFERLFYRTRTPVVVTGVARDWRATQTWDPETLRADIIEEGESKVIRWYWDVTSDFRKGDYQTPAILSHLQRLSDAGLGDSIRPAVAVGTDETLEAARAVLDEARAMHAALRTLR